MTGTDDFDWDRIENAIERFFLLQEEEPASTVEDACGGDETLAARVREALAHLPAYVAAPVGALQEGAHIGDYSIRERIGRGGMGTVYRAIERSLGREVALKLIDPQALAHPGARARFRREAEITAALEHPNIVPVYGVGEFEGQPYLAMKRLSGPTLAELDRPLPPSEAAAIGIAVARALEVSHLHGVVHRDVKPHNIILDHGTPYVVDFGLARAHSDTTVTQAGRVPGTLRYLAPERLEATGAAVLDPRIDVYGLGVTLYELVAGRPPFAGTTPTALLRTILAGAPRPLRLRRAEADFATIVGRAMAADPRKRFATAAALADDLERYLAGAPIVSRRITLVERAWRSVRRHKRVSATIGVLTLVLMVVSGVLLVSRQRARADRATRLGAADAMAARRDFPGAMATLALLGRNDPRDDEVAARLRRVEGEQALDDLLVHVANRTVNVPRAEVDRLCASVVAGTFAVPRARTAKLVLIATVAHHDGAAAALERLAGERSVLGDSRAVVVVQRWLESWLAEGVAAFDGLPAPAADAESDEAVLTAAVMRLAGQQVAVWSAELEPWVGQMPPPPLVRFMQAIALCDSARDLDAMHVLLGVTDATRPQAHVWRTLAGVYLRLGRLPQARAALTRVTDDAPATWYFRLQLACLEAAAEGRIEPFAAFGGVLETVRLVHPSAEVERFAAEYYGLHPARTPAAVADLRRLLADRTGDAFGRDLTVAAMVFVAAQRLPAPASLASADEIAQNRTFLTTYRPLAEHVRYPPARVSALTWIARALCAVAAEPADAGGGAQGVAIPPQLLEGLALFESLVAAQPRARDAVIEYGDVVVRNFERLPDAPRYAHASAARIAVRALLRAQDDGELRLDDVDRNRAMTVAWQLARVAFDWNDVRRWATRLLAEAQLDEPYASYCRESLADARQQLGDQR
ncbi:MAG: serine/threonine-protein kinase [Planctomycetota bacterium]